MFFAGAEKNVLTYEDEKKNKKYPRLQRNTTFKLLWPKYYGPKKKIQQSLFLKYFYLIPEYFLWVKIASYKFNKSAMLAALHSFSVRGRLFTTLHWLIYDAKWKQPKTRENEGETLK